MENQKSIELSLSDFFKKEGVDNIRDDETFCVAEYEAVRDYCFQKEFLLSSKDLLEIKSRRLEYSYDMWKEHFQEEKKDRLIKFLLNQDLSETESEEVLNNFVESINEKDLHVVAIFESFTDLANNYVDTVHDGNGCCVTKKKHSMYCHYCDSERLSPKVSKSATSVSVSARADGTIVVTIPRGQKVEIVSL